MNLFPSHDNMLVKNHINVKVNMDEMDVTAAESITENAIDTLEAAASVMDISFAVSGETAPVTAIPQLLYSIAYNLCDNAIKYNHHGGSVSVSVLQDEQHTVLTVRDTGKLTSTHLSEEESARVTEYLKLIGDYERIADHAVNILESAEEMRSKGVTFSENAAAEYKMICDAVTEILDLSYQAFSKENYYSARKTEPLEQVINKLKEDLRTRHFIRLQNRECSVAAGFVWSDLLTNLERVSDHCSNIAGCVLDTAGRNMTKHENQRIIRGSKEDYEQQYNMYLAKYSS